MKWKARAVLAAALFVRQHDSDSWDDTSTLSVILIDLIEPYDLGLLSSLALGRSMFLDIGQYP
jgi:hypothetical protein